MPVAIWSSDDTEPEDITRFVETLSSALARRDAR